MSEEERSPEVPKLSLSQKVLASLPQIRREPSLPGSNKARPQKAPPASGSPGDQLPRDDEAPRTFGQKLSKAMLKPDPKGPDAKHDPTLDLSNEEIEQRIKRLDDKERTYGFIAAALGLVFTILLTAVTLAQNPAPGHKNYASPGTILLEGGIRIVLVAVVAITSFTRRRSLVGFALLFFGTTIIPFGFAYWGLGGWLIWRVFKMQKILSSRGVDMRRSRQAASATARSEKPRTTRDASARAADIAARRRAKRQPEPKGPTASKRYTPPKPVRPRPPKPE